MRRSDRGLLAGRLLRGGLVATMIALGLAGCGRRGALQPPPDPSAPAIAKPGNNNGIIDRRPRKVPITPPHDSFILDPLL